ncbi:uncharacterized protein LOC124925659 [Impatiens glandulifera]|uniref:uncharacterized protein LOC124925659 n=1 Tax=Impatiens glandulifera TaxID=253017 RepID=UPI001FB08DEF|nr:uncharacterized protein LOC124925659 [Impatiens glandulifera]
MSAAVIDDGGSSSRSFTGMSGEDTSKISIDLVAAARRNVSFLRFVADSDWLHHKPTLVEAVRRYTELWMPLISDLTAESKPPMILPPIDVEWVWYCHTLNPVNYRQYCERKFSRLIGKSSIFDEENEEYAMNRCRELWIHRYPSDPFENGIGSEDPIPSMENEDILHQVLDKRALISMFSEPYMSETVYLIAARQRYKRFLCFLQKLEDEHRRLVPALDIQLMWLTHQSFSTVYASDTKEIEENLTKVLSLWEAVNEEEVEASKKLWEKELDLPYEKAGGGFNQQAAKLKPPFHWDVTEIDVNTKYKSMLPRFTLEVCIFVKLKMTDRGKVCNEFLRLRVVRCHKELKLDKPLSTFFSDSWQKAWHLYCEFGTRGIDLQLRRKGTWCSKGSSTLEDHFTFLWNDELRETSLSLDRDIGQRVRAVTSITPPVQSSYFLKCVPDRVTDDSGAVISDVILRMNSYRPQEGRWLSRTVLDHAGRECFVVRMRVGGGIWRRGGETPSIVKWEDRITEIREGSWAYVAGSIGRAPEKVVGTAKPKEPPEQWNASWKLSTGEELLIMWESSSSMRFQLRNETSTDSSTVKLLNGRQKQYHWRTSMDNEEFEENNEEEVGFLTLVRYSEDSPSGKATALLNWKLLAVEFQPEEDAVFLLLICVSILRSVSETSKEDSSGLLIRRRLKEASLGSRDLGSVVLHPSSWSPSIASPHHHQPWYWNAKKVTTNDGSADEFKRQPATNNSQAEGGTKLYKELWTKK